MKNQSHNVWTHEVIPASKIKDHGLFGVAFGRLLCAAGGNSIKGMMDITGEPCGTESLYDWQDALLIEYLHIMAKTLKAQPVMNRDEWFEYIATVCSNIKESRLEVEHGLEDSLYNCDPTELHRSLPPVGTRLVIQAVKKQVFAEVVLLPEALDRDLFGKRSEFTTRILILSGESTGMVLKTPEEAVRWGLWSSNIPPGSLKGWRNIMYCPHRIAKGNITKEAQQFINDRKMYTKGMPKNYPSAVVGMEAELVIPIRFYASQSEIMNGLAQTIFGKASSSTITNSVQAPTAPAHVPCECKCNQDKVTVSVESMATVIDVCDFLIDLKSSLGPEKDFTKRVAGQLVERLTNGFGLKRLPIQ